MMKTPVQLISQDTEKIKWDHVNQGSCQYGAVTTITTTTITSRK